MRLILLLLAMLVSTISNAATLTIDFEEFSQGDGLLQGESIELAQGFTITVDSGNHPFFAGPSYPFGTASPVLSPGGSVTLSLTDGGIFDFHSLDLNPSNIESGTFDLIGTVAGGGTINIASSLECCAFNQDFSGQFNNLTSLQIVNNYDAAIMFDNIVVTTVPVPAAVWLFGSALAGLGWIRRKPTV